MYDLWSSLENNFLFSSAGIHFLDQYICQFFKLASYKNDKTGCYPQLSQSGEPYFSTLHSMDGEILLTLRSSLNSSSLPCTVWRHCLMILCAEIPDPNQKGLYLDPR